MEHITADVRRNREDRYFLQQEQKRLDELRRKSEKEAEALRLMEAFGIREPELVRELSDAGFDAETLRMLYLVPLIQVAWSDGEVSEAEKARILEIAGVHGIGEGGAAHARLHEWLKARPSERFFQASMRGIRAMLHERPAAEAESLRRDLAGYCIRIASASGGFFGLGSRISREEELLLAKLAEEVDARRHGAAGRVTRELSR